MGGSGMRQVHQVVLPFGSGPRHMVHHPSGHLYVVAELSCEVFVLAPDVTGAWRLIGGTPLGAGILPGDTAAELASSRDGVFLYAGVRGSNTIATLRVRGAGNCPPRLRFRCRSFRATPRPRSLASLRLS